MGLFFAAAILISAMALKREPPWVTDNSSSHAAPGEEDTSYEMVLHSTLQMMPAAIFSATLLAEVWPENDEARRPKRPRTAIALLSAGLAVDFASLGHFPLLASYIPLSLGRKHAVHIVQTFTWAIRESPTGAWL